MLNDGRSAAGRVRRALRFVSMGTMGLSLLAVTGCGSRPPAGPELTQYVGPLAVPYPDSVDAALSDTLEATPPPTKGAPRTKRKKSAATPPATVSTTPPLAATPPPVAAGTSEATGQETAPPATAAAATPPADSAAGAPPLLTVRVSPTEAVKLTERWQGEVSRAEKALELLRSYALSGEPADQVAAAKKFLAESRAARGASDLFRAAELAEKARVLAEAVKTSMGIK